MKIIFRPIGHAYIFLCKSALFVNSLKKKKWHNFVAQSLMYFVVFCTGGITVKMKENKKFRQTFVPKSPSPPE